MTGRRVFTVSLGILLSTLAASTHAELSGDELYDLLKQANEAFRQANALVADPQAETFYKKAILSYERIINEGRIRNAKLFYNLANAYLLTENVGKAILNYRRAEQLDGADANIRKNLEFARAQRIDKIAPRTEERVLETLFFWHYDLALHTRFVLSCVLFAAACISVTMMIWLGRSPPKTVVATIAGLLMLCFAVSVAVESRRRVATVCGVITEAQVVARQGDGQGYPQSFKDPLHAGTEFDLLERRPGWLHIKLADDSDGWIPDTAAELI